MVLQVKAMIRQRLVDDELVWVFIDKGLVTESEVTWLRGGAPLPPRGGQG
jgi:GMP synthase PP-ATPase subunit